MPISTTAKISLLNLIYIPCVPLLTYLSLPPEQIAILAILLVIDYLTGITKVIIIKGGLKSYRSITGAVTKAFILLLVLTLAFMAKGINLDIEVYLGSFISILIISETYSIFGNVYACIKKEDIEEVDAVATVIGKVREYIGKLIVASRSEV